VDVWSNATTPTQVRLHEAGLLTEDSEVR